MFFVMAPMLRLRRATGNLAAMTITPDTKNWTWVLDRPCPECGFEAAAFPREEVAALLRRNAAGWRALFDASDTSEASDGSGGSGAGRDLRERPEPEKWSPLEYACHVRDCCAVYDERLRLMLAEDGPSYPNWDQDETAVASDYRSQDPDLVDAQLAAAAEALASRFETVATDDQWRRTGFRGDGSAFTVETFARYFIHDPIHHLWDATGKRADEQ
jgi:hypothetical protein